MVANIIRDHFLCVDAGNICDILDMIALALM